MHNIDGIKQTLGRHRLPSVLQLCDQCQHYFLMLVMLRMKADQLLTNPSKTAQTHLLILPKWTFLCSVQSLAMASVQGGQTRIFCCLGNEVGVRSNSKWERGNGKVAHRGHSHLLFFPWQSHVFSIVYVFHVHSLALWVGPRPSTFQVTYTPPQCESK